MKAIHSIIAAAAFVCAEPAQAAVNSPEIIIYRFPGVLDDAGAFNSTRATVFHCTNFSGVTENIRFVTRGFDSSLRSNKVFSIQHLATVMVSTHDTVVYVEDFLLDTGIVAQGTTAIAATSINLICTAETIDANAPTPIGIARRGIRFSPVPGTQE
jgi:hypothetical protein